MTPPGSGEIERGGLAAAAIRDSHIRKRDVKGLITELNSAQRDAVEAGDGPALVLAGAGSGKTRVIVERIIWLIDELGVDPRNILALTFTNRAAEEMRSRVASRLHTSRLASWVGTFHAFGLYVIRREMAQLGRPKTFTVFDDTDQLALMKRLIKELPSGLPRVSPREAMRWIGALKQDLETPDEEADPELEEEPAYRALWDRYHETLERVSAVDFDDLLVLTAKLLNEHPDVLDKYRRRFQHILVDEYQDTNHAQYIIARALSGDDGNLFVVGDEDQSIYSWRGADIRNILDFESDFPGATVYRLEQNYRSTAPILAAANAVVSHNADRLGKTLWTDKSGGESVTFHLAKDGEDEAHFVVDTIAKRNLALRDVAVMYRTNGQARLVEEAFLRKGLAYTVVGGIRFYARREIKDLLAYMRLLVNPSDDEALRRVINVPPRGFGPASLEQLEERARALDCPLLDALRQLGQDDSAAPRMRKTAAEFAKIVDEAAEEAESTAVEAILEDLLKATSYREFVEKSDEKDFRTRLEVVDEFASACAQFDEKGSGGLHGFLQELSLATDTDGFEPGAPAAALITCHSAKGLEFEHVFLIGLEEGFLPHAIALDSDEDIGEERRLCYVAMTRARKTLTLSAAESRLVYGERKDRAVSRFVDEISHERLVRTGSAELVRAGAGETDARRADASKLKMGTRVRHAKFGTGVVMYTSGTGSKLKVRIRFERGMPRQFMVSATPLEILEGNVK